MRDAELQQLPLSPALVVRNLRVEITSGAAIVDRVDLALSAGEILGLVGESGSGKTTTALAMLGFTTPGAVIVDGTLEIRGTRLRLDEAMRGHRGRLIAYVPQNPGRALNPSMRIRDYVKDVARDHSMESAHNGWVGDLFDRVGLPRSDEFTSRYPHQISGGQQQRVCIAAALACDPAVIVLDEPTTGLDVVTQARILQELAELRTRMGTAMIYVTHDLAVVSQLADQVAVMYAGQVVEHGPTRQILRRPRHPYTRGLLASIPDHVSPMRLQPMPGIAAAAGDNDLGCAFQPRCPQAQGDCVVDRPVLEVVSVKESVRCWHWDDTNELARFAGGL